MQIVELYQLGRSVNYLSDEYGVSTVTIYKWIKEMSSKKGEDPSIRSKEYQIMKKRIAQLEMENEILKKAVYQNQYNSFEKASRAIFKYIEIWYSQKRIHRSIDYLTPGQKHNLAA